MYNSKSASGYSDSESKDVDLCMRILPGVVAAYADSYRTDATIRLLLAEASFDDPSNACDPMEGESMVLLILVG